MARVTHVFDDSDFFEDNLDEAIRCFQGKTDLRFDIDWELFDEDQVFGGHYHIIVSTDVPGVTEQELMDEFLAYKERHYHVTGNYNPDEFDDNPLF